MVSPEVLKAAIAAQKELQAKTTGGDAGATRVKKARSVNIFNVTLSAITIIFFFIIVIAFLFPLFGLFSFVFIRFFVWLLAFLRFCFVCLI